MNRKAAWLLLCQPAWAFAQASGNETLLAPVEVSASRPPLSAPVGQSNYSVSQVSADGVATLGGPAQSNPYRALDLMPSVNLSGTDAYGLSVDQNFLRIRGISAYTYSNMASTIEGIPSSVSVAQGGMGNLFDLENVAGISLYRGPQPANVGFGFGNMAGAMDLSLRGPEDKLGAMVKASGGSEGFHKYFARFDSGKLGPGETRFFFSASNSDTDKWKGPGEQFRDTVNAGLAQPLGDKASVELYAAHNKFKRDEYRSLTYAQSQDLGTYRSYDYNPTLTGKAAQDVNYYGYNTQSFEETNVFAKLRWQLGENTEVRLKPYWLNTEGYRFVGSGTAVNKVNLEQDQKGLVAEVATRIYGQNLVAGWWTQRITTMPPPLSQKRYNIDATGKLTYAGWGILADMAAREYDSPFLQLNGQSGNWQYGVGVRQLRFTMPGITTYTTTGLPDVDREVAISANPPVNASLTTTGTTLNATLPTLNSRWTLSDALDLRATYGRTVGNPWMGPLYSTYQSNATAFQKAGVSLQKLWNDLKLEVVDTAETGLVWRGRDWTLSPTVYYSRIKDKQVNAYDPGVGVSYLQSGVHAKAWGAELEGSYALSNAWNFLGSVSWNINRLDDDIRTGSGSTLSSKGKQVPDAPRFLLKLAAEYRSGPWSLTPVVRYVGERYGDALNTEKVSAYTVADFHGVYRFGPSLGMRQVEAGFSLLNIFDRAYISSINAGQDDARPGATTYFVGAPRTAVLSLTARY